MWVSAELPLVAVLLVLAALEAWREAVLWKRRRRNIKSKLADFFALEFKSVSPPYVFGVGLSTAFEMQIASGSPDLAAGKISKGTLQNPV